MQSKDGSKQIQHVQHAEKELLQRRALKLDKLYKKIDGKKK
jgi:hypothetical protein